jgi:hypothetical protein
MRLVRFVSASLCLCFVMAAAPAFAQQTGTISGAVTASDGSMLPGVTVEARSDVLPGPRSTVTGSDGAYSLPALPPGAYTLTIVLSGMQTVTRKADVQLGQTTTVDAKLSVAGVEETVNVTARASLIEHDSAAIKSGLSGEEMRSLPIGQEYRDLVKLIPGVQYTQDTTRGPSAGGSGQDNVYQFDGVNVTLPLFGTLSAEPATHDIAQISTVKGGAQAIDFNRSGGFLIDSVSKSGTNKYLGDLGYQFENKGLVSPQLASATATKYDRSRGWFDGNFGGPIAPDRLFFYASYYRPEDRRDNQANAYGAVPKFDSRRNEGFIKGTYTPAHAVLLDVSFRDSHRLDAGDTFLANASGTTGTGNESWQKIGTAEGSWIIDPKSLLTVKYTHFTLRTQGRPDNVSSASVNTAVGTQLNIGALDSQGLLSVPSVIAGQDAFNAFIQPLVNQYGFVSATTGQRTGGGSVGFATTFDADNFFRDGVQFGYNRTFGTTTKHNVHGGFQYYIDSEDLGRSSNGWGSITVPGGRTTFPAGGAGTPIFFQASFQQQTTGAAPVIHSEYRSKSFELNDTINWKNWTFNLGLMDSNDTLYGQGLQVDPSTISGFGTKAPGSKYQMYDIPFKKMLQPRLSGTWAYDGNNTVYASFATYNPSASSLPRAASWDRNLEATINAYFDASGKLFALDPVKSSSGKLFVPDMTPRTVREYLVGTARQFNPHWSGRLYARYRKGDHFWEDTNNNARVAFQPPPGIPQTLYIPNLSAMLAQIGSGSTYVITELDGAFTKYYEATAESEYRSGKVFARGSYTWSHYYGNFDQDNSSIGNDANIFIGSSNIGDDAGRQLWNNKYGNLRGDRPNLLKLYGSYQLDWKASIGAFIVGQSGQPWEAWSFEPYKALTTSTSDTARYAEPAGSRVTPAHWQVDMDYTQNIPAWKRYNFMILADLYNVFNSQTGYNYDPSVHSSTFGQPRTYWDPRRFLITARMRF